MSSDLDPEKPRVLFVSPHGHAPDGTPIVSAVAADFAPEANL